MKKLKSPSPRYPKCFIINEIGAVCYEGEEKAKKAEKVLRGLLSSKSQEDRLLAFCCLSVTRKENLDQETLVELENFKGRPENQTIISEAEQAIERYRVRYQQQNN